MPTRNISGQQYDTKIGVACPKGKEISVKMD